MQDKEQVQIAIDNTLKISSTGFSLPISGLNQAALPVSCSNFQICIFQWVYLLTLGERLLPCHSFAILPIGSISGAGNMYFC
jgi:hypothetical protein